MNIDERLSRLTERHEALTGHVEILTADLTQLTKRVDELTVNMDDLTANVEKQRRTMDDLMVGFSTFVALARGHESRVGRLGGHERI
jgi:archaellum component FlaC